MAAKPFAEVAGRGVQEFVEGPMSDALGPLTEDLR
jgi:hypothetical protein